jgi:hypothetical protein
LSQVAGCVLERNFKSYILIPSFPSVSNSTRDWYGKVTLNCIKAFCFRFDSFQVPLYLNFLALWHCGETQYVVFLFDIYCYVWVLFTLICCKDIFVCAIQIRVCCYIAKHRYTTDVTLHRVTIYFAF